MLDSISLTTIVLSELLFLLSLIIIFLWLALIKYRAKYQFALEEYRKLRQNAQVSRSPELLGLDLPSGSHPTPDEVDIYLKNVNQESLAYFKKTSQRALPRLTPDLPFSAKVATLRYHYTKAEAEIRRESTINDGHWLLLEKKLAEILRWIAPPKKLPQAKPNNRIRLLQEKIDVLKPFEKENAQLHRKLQANEDKQKRLEEYEHDSKETLSKMQRIIDVLQLANSGNNETINNRVHETFNAEKPDRGWVDADKTIQTSVKQLDDMSEISERKHSLVRKMVDDLPYAYKDLSSEQRQKMANAINSLEKDLLKSDHHIAALQKELKAARQSMQPAIIVSDKPVTPFNKYALGKEALLNPHANIPLTVAETDGDEKQTLTITHTTSFADDTPPAIPNDWVTQGGHQRTLKEIQLLRDNNQSQRNMIITMESELNILRDAMHATTDEVEKAEKGKDIDRLERLVKECEYCIETLESEVDLLYSQLQHTAPAEPVVMQPQKEIEQLNQELESISNKLKGTIKQYTQTSIFNRFTVDVVACNTLEQLSKTTIKLIKDLQITAGFYLHAAIGQAEFYAGNSFTSSEQAMIKQANSITSVAYLNEGILFSQPHAHLMLHNPPDDDDQQLQLENILSDVVRILSTQTKHMETDILFQRHNRKLDNWTDKTKKQLLQLDIQHAHQTEESQKIVDHLTKELKAFIGMVNISDTARMVFDNAVGECHQRLQLLLDSSKIVDKTSSDLIKSLEHLKDQKS